MNVSSTYYILLVYPSSLTRINILVVSSLVFLGFSSIAFLVGLLGQASSQNPCTSWQQLALVQKWCSHEQRSHAVTLPATTMNEGDLYDLRAKYTHFRVLVIGRANAGKTTLLQRVCNTTEDPCIYDDNNKNLVSVHIPEDEFCFWRFRLAWTYLSGTPLYYRCLVYIWLNPYQRGIHDINRPFAFKSNPRFIFHDSPGFETGDEKQLQEVLSFMEEKAKSTDVDNQLHAIWSVLLSQRTYWLLMINSAVKGFVLFWTMLGLYYRWKRCSLIRRGQEKVSFTPSFRLSLRINIFQCLSSQYLPNSTTWWLKSITSMKMTMSIAKMRRNKWKKSSENLCMSMPFRRARMSASKVSGG